MLALLSSVLDLGDVVGASRVLDTLDPMTLMLPMSERLLFSSSS